MRVETRKKGSGEKGKYKLGYAAAAKHVGKCLVCPPRDCSSAINVCKKFFSELHQSTHNDEELVVAQHRASFMEALVRIHDCHIWHRHFRIRALSSYDIQLSRVYNHHYSCTTPKDLRAKSPRQESGTCKRRVLQGLGFKGSYLRFRQIKEKNTQQGNKGRKKKGLESKQKTTPQSAKPTMGSLKRRNQITYDLNPSLV